MYFLIFKLHKTITVLIHEQLIQYQTVKVNIWRKNNINKKALDQMSALAIISSFTIKKNHLYNHHDHVFQCSKKQF